MLGRDEPRPVLTVGDAKTGIGTNATTFVEAMSAYHKVAAVLPVDVCLHANVCIAAGAGTARSEG